MAWKVVPLSSMTTFFSSIVRVNSMIFGPCLVACSCACTKGGATSSIFWRGSLRSSAALAGRGAASSRAAAAALRSAALRVNIGSLLAFDYRRTLLFSPQPNLLCNKYRRDWRQTKESYVGQRSRIGDSTLTVSFAETVMPTRAALHLDGKPNARRQRERQEGDAGNETGPHPGRRARICNFAAAGAEVVKVRNLTADAEHPHDHVNNSEAHRAGPQRSSMIYCRLKTARSYCASAKNSE